ncbi:hypothetical protein [Neobacillus niacini]|uniref:hypothetical protein n=1 Tax=Neobacillus niacini TaxID=86668 RepID=UPI0021CB2BD4|nr:hypothetical protein [Neobacillus niacini]MCM3764686.1 hypothetical protein [Neobacillus niacini]
MKKKIMALLFGGAMAFSLFAAPGNPVQAAENDDCGCHDLVPLSGAERNKIVAKFLSSDAFKDKKAELLSSGNKWNGAHTIEVVLPAEGVTMIGVPFIDANGVPLMYVFLNGTFVGTAPVN